MGDKEELGKEKSRKFLIGLIVGFLVFFVTASVASYFKNPDVAFYIVLFYLFTPVIVYLLTKNKNITKGYAYSLLILIFLIFMVSALVVL